MIKLSQGEVLYEMKVTINDRIKPVTDVQPHHFLQEDLNLDSLDRLELLMYLEEKFNIDIPDSEYRLFQTVQDILDYLQKHNRLKD